MSEEKYDYELIVIGGGSGGLACAKEAAKYVPGKIACFDYVKPSPQGTKWGLGGTCVNVGCIPKKIMHFAGLLRKGVDDAQELGWNFQGEPHLDWKKLVENVNNFIRGLNFQYKVQLSSANVTYINAFATLVDKNTLQYIHPESHQVTKVRFRNLVIAVGGRPKYPDAPGAKEFGISSDDIFWTKKEPKKTLVVGASYIALECGGFLSEMGYDVTIMVRSILLRGFDQQMANTIGELMELNGVRFIRPANVMKLEKLKPKDTVSNSDTKMNIDVKDENVPITVTYQMDDDKSIHTEQFDTVLFAIGRDACVNGIGLAEAGVKLANGKIVTNEAEQTSVENIYAIGDCALNRPELTPVAIQAGLLLARRIFGRETKLMDYNLVPTTVFTPIEYGCVGFSEEDAIKRLGANNVETYLSRYGSLEVACTHPKLRKQVRSFIFHPKEENEVEDIKLLSQTNLAKLVCDKTKKNKVVGFHFMGANAGEITQGFAIGLRLGATKQDFNELVGIHPTAAEEFTLLTVSRSSGEDFRKKDGC